MARASARPIHIATTVVFLLALGTHLTGDAFVWLQDRGLLPKRVAEASTAFRSDDAFRNILVPDEKLGFRLAGPEASEQAGRRVYAGRSYSVAKPAGVFRILCVGGSTTLGVENPKHSYPAILQEYFDQALVNCPLRVEVINAGIMGYHSWHTRLRAEPELDALSPDLCVVMDGLNDVVAAGSIADVEEAVRQKSVFTSLMRMGRPGATETAARRDGWGELVKLLDASPVFKSSRMLLESLFVADTMDRKMAAFGYEDNMEAFIAGRKAKGIDVALLNYGWITRRGASPAAESERVPFPLDAALFLYGRDYVAEVNRRLARKDAVTLIDVQPWVDSLDSAAPSVHRLFADEVHYTQFMNFFVAREAYLRIADAAHFRAALAGCAPLPLREVDDALNYRLGWGEYKVANGFPGPEAKACGVVELSRRGLTAPPDEPCREAGQWCVLQPETPDTQGELVVRLESACEGGELTYYPRIFSNRGRVDVDVATPEGWHRASELYRAVADGEWSPLEAGYRIDTGPGEGPGKVLRFRLSGKAQIYLRDGGLLFRSGQKGRSGN